MSNFFTSQHMPCAECGASVPVAELDTHVCERERQLEFLLFQVRDEVAGLEDDVRGYLESPHGRFAQWLAERDRRPD